MRVADTQKIITLVRNGAKIGYPWVRLTGNLEPHHPGYYNIGNYVSLGAEVRVITHCPITCRKDDFEKKEIFIDDHVWIGFRSSVLPGTRIGRACIVGCDSVLKGKYPDYAVIAGNPAKFIRYLSVKEILDNYLTLWIHNFNSGCGKINWNRLKEDCHRKVIQDLFSIDPSYDINLATDSYVARSLSNLMEQRKKLLEASCKVDSYNSFIDSIAA